MLAPGAASSCDEVDTRHARSTFQQHRLNLDSSLRSYILAGPAGHGKTTVLIKLGSTITTGGLWPDNTPAQVGKIAIWSGEDDPADTLVPRLLACGADLNRVHIVQEVVDAGGQRSFDPAFDIPILRQSLFGKPIKLLIVDPIVSAVAGDSHKNAETRRALQPLVDLAAELSCAIFGITHFTKGTSGRDPVERVTGSLAFGALTRLVIVTTKLPNDGNHPPDARLFARAKSNIGPDGGGFYYFLKQIAVPGYPGISNTTVSWGSAVYGTAHELLNKAEIIDLDQSAINDATLWLEHVLSNGPVPAAEVHKKGRQDGFTKSTINRAKERLNIKPIKEGYQGPWSWSLPSTHPGVKSLNEKNL